MRRFSAQKNPSQTQENEVKPKVNGWKTDSPDKTNRESEMKTNEVKRSKT